MGWYGTLDHRRLSPVRSNLTDTHVRDRGWLTIKTGSQRPRFFASAFGVDHSENYAVTAEGLGHALKLMPMILFAAIRSASMVLAASLTKMRVATEGSRKMVGSVGTNCS